MPLPESGTLLRRGRQLQPDAAGDGRAARARKAERHPGDRGRRRVHRQRRVRAARDRRRLVDRAALQRFYVRIPQPSYC